jgi:hypothetical protein
MHYVGVDQDGPAHHRYSRLRDWWKIEKPSPGPSLGLVLGEMVALQDEPVDGKQAQDDQNGAECVVEESVDHNSPLSLVWFCGFHDLGGATQERGLNLIRDSTPAARNI